MKKFLVAVLVIAMVGMIGLVAVADSTYFDAKTDLITKVTVNADGTVTVGIDENFIKEKGPGTMKIALFSKDVKMTADDDASFWKIYRSDEKSHADHDSATVWAKQITPAAAEVTIPADAGLKEGEVYCITVCANKDGMSARWDYSTTLHKFTYAQGASDEPAPTADVSTIAFAVASVLGCGALVVRKKR